MKYIVYILYSKSHDRYYIGQTHDITARLSRHNNKLEKSTSPYTPWTIACLIEKESRSDAVVLEKKLKNLNKQKLLNFINKYT